MCEKLATAYDVIIKKLTTDFFSFPPFPPSRWFLASLFSKESADLNDHKSVRQYRFAASVVHLQQTIELVDLCVKLSCVTILVTLT